MTALQPLIWYKDGGTNVGTLASSGDFVQANSQTTITSITGVTGATINCLRVVPTTLPQLSATTTLPFSQTIPSYAGIGVYAISFWFKLIATTKLSGTALFSYTINGGTRYVFLSATGLSVNGTLVNLGSPALWDSQWHFFCVYARGGGGSDTYMIDSAAGYPASTINEADKTMAGFIPGYSSTSGAALNGYIADLRIYGGYYPNGGSPSAHAFDYMYKIGKNVNLATLSTAPAYLLIHANASYAQLLAAGYTATTLLGSPSNIAASALYAIGATIAQLRAIQTVLQLIAGGITIDNLLAVPYTYTQLIVNESVTKTQFDSGGKTIQNLIAGGVIISNLVTAGYTIPNLIAGGTTFGELVTGGIAISTLLGSPNNYTMPQLFAGGVTIAQFIAAPYTVLQLIAGGITIDNLLAQYTYTQLIDNSVTKTQFDSGGKTIQNLIAGGVTISKLVTAQYSFSQMIAGGVTSTQFTAQGYSIADLVNGGVTNRELLSAGYSLVELQTAGILPAWNIDTSANHIIKSYFQDFVDVSGSIILRENSNLYINGNAETAGNISLNRLVVTADASFNRRIFVGGDVSMNGNVAMIGDLSMNGTVTKCNFNNSSIPKSAFVSTVPDGPNYNTSKIVYDQTFQSNDDVSMNGAAFASNNVKVSGNIVFNDGTVMNTADNNILTTNPTVFKPSTFTALDICGNLVAGSYATSSDYRIKTNVVELDETYTVDKLRPVKYFQTQINREKYGLIAHELQEHYPDLVIGEKDGSELQRVNYTGLIAILINDIKRLKRELTELENEVVVGR